MSPVHNVAMKKRMARRRREQEEKCLWCGEEIKPGECADHIGSDLHPECLSRFIGDPVGYMQKTSCCFGGIEEDPPALTRCEAARAALAEWQKVDGWTGVHSSNEDCVGLITA